MIINEWMSLTSSVFIVAFVSLETELTSIVMATDNQIADLQKRLGALELKVNDLEQYYTLSVVDIFFLDIITNEWMMSLMWYQ